jgi:hypothetical protein
MKIGGYVAFALECREFDPDGCEDELRRAGFEVIRLPDSYRPRLEIKTDDFLLVMTEGSDDSRFISAIMDLIDAIADRYGGGMWECGLINTAIAPFEDLFGNVQFH